MKEMSQTVRDVLNKQIISNMEGKINYIVIPWLFLVDFASPFEVTNNSRILAPHSKTSLLFSTIFFS